MPFVQAKCPECGGMLAVDADKKAAVCQFCCEAFIVQEAINNYNTYNTTNNTYDNRTTHNYGDGTVVNVYEDQNKDFVIEAETLKEYHGESTEVVIPDGVCEIGEKAFAGLGITDVTIPESVTKIGGSAFEHCINLTSIVIPDGVTEIGRFVFRGCTSLMSITIPDSVTGIGYCAFEGCASLMSISIPDSVTEIGEGAFNGCTNLTTITIPFSISVTKSIGSSFYVSIDVFEGCESLKRIRIHYLSPNKTVCDFLGEKTQFVTDVQIDPSVKKLGPGVFRSCTSLTSIIIPDSVTEIGNCAFKGCVNLTSISIPDSVTEIGAEAFDGCISLTNVTIPNSVKKIGIYAFRQYWESKGLCPRCGGKFGFFGKCSRDGCKELKPKATKRR